MDRSDLEPTMVVLFFLLAGAVIAFLLSWILTDSNACLYGAGVSFALALLACFIGARAG